MVIFEKDAFNHRVKRDWKEAREEVLKLVSYYYN